MRVLKKGRSAVLLVAIIASTTVILPTGAGAQAPAGHVRAVASSGAATVSKVAASQLPVIVVPPGTTGVVLGPATAYVRGADGVVRRVR